MSDVKCPYCGLDQEICHDDGYGYQEDETFEQMCGHCEMSFSYTTSILFYYDAAQAPCMNDGNHKWAATFTYPRDYSKWRCEYCDQKERMDKGDIEKLNAGTAPKDLVRNMTEP